MCDELDLDVCSPSSSSSSSPDEGAASGNQVILVPPDLASVLINSKGDRIKRIANETKTIIKVWRDEACRRQTDPVKVIIIGQPRNRKVAAKEVDDLIHGIDCANADKFVENLAMGKEIQDNICTGWEQAVRIPGYLVQSLIGPNGQNIRELAGFSKATLKVERHKDGRARVMVSGTSAAKLDAKKKILQFIERYERQQTVLERHKAKLAEEANSRLKDVATPKFSPKSPPKGASSSANGDITWEKTQAHIEQMKRTLGGGVVLAAPEAPKRPARPQPASKSRAASKAAKAMAEPRYGPRSAGRVQEAKSSTQRSTQAPKPLVERAQPLYPPASGYSRLRNVAHSIENAAPWYPPRDGAPVEDKCATHSEEATLREDVPLGADMAPRKHFSLAERAPDSACRSKFAPHSGSAPSPLRERASDPAFRSEVVPQDEYVPPYEYERPEYVPVGTQLPPHVRSPPPPPVRPPPPPPRDSPPPARSHVFRPPPAPEPQEPEQEPMLAHATVPELSYTLDNMDDDEDSDWEEVDGLEAVDEWIPEVEYGSPRLECEPRVITRHGDEDLEDEYDPFNTLPESDDGESIDMDALLNPIETEPFVRGTIIDDFAVCTATVNTADADYVSTPTCFSTPRCASDASPQSIAAAIAASLQGGFSTPLGKKRRTD